MDTDPNISSIYKKTKKQNSVTIKCHNINYQYIWPEKLERVNLMDCPKILNGVDFDSAHAVSEACRFAKMNRQLILNSSSNRHIYMDRY
jgi:hypothetical protein